MGYVGQVPPQSPAVITSAEIVDGTISNADLAAAAAIAVSKTALVAGTGITLDANTLNVDPSQAQITTVGTIGVGTWQSTDVGVEYGGTGASELADHGVVLGSGTDPVSVTAAGTSGQVLISGGASADPDWAALPATGVVGTAVTLSDVVLAEIMKLPDVQTVTGTKTLNGTASTLGVVLLNAAETTTITATVPPATVNFDAATQSVLVYTTNANATWITNLRFSSGTTMNTALAVGQSLSVTLMAAQGGTAYLGTTFKIDGQATTPLWQGGIPTAAGASGTDVYTYTITKTASATYRVLASMSSFA